MGTKFYFKEITVKNFRVFKDISFKKLRRINIISGINGSGKSAIMETLFLTLDLNNALCLLRPFQWRNIPLGGDELKLLFPSLSEIGKVSVSTNTGTLVIDLNFGAPADNIILSASQSVDPQARSALSQLSSPNLQGVSIVAKSKKIGGDENAANLFVSQSGDIVNATGVGTAAYTNTPGVYLSQTMAVAPQEGADRLSKLIKQGKKSKIIEYIRLLRPEIKDIAVFQDGPVSQVYVELGDNNFVPVSLMGGGMRALADIVVSVMVSSNGVVFIDELDSALHFSAIPKLWSIIAEIANAENVQIFAVTHSREAIESAAAGIKSSGRSADFQYVRIDDRGDHHSCSHYDMIELGDAMELSVEIR